MEKSKNELKKALYREKPLAKLSNSNKELFTYIAETSIGNVTFKVPTNDMGETIFHPYMPAQLLIRWM